MYYVDTIEKILINTSFNPVLACYCLRDKNRYTAVISMKNNICFCANGKNYIIIDGRKCIEKF